MVRAPRDHVGFLAWHSLVTPHFWLLPSAELFCHLHGAARPGRVDPRGLASLLESTRAEKGGYCPQEMQCYSSSIS